MSVEEAARILIKAKIGIAFTGAGVSTESGVPDFRSPGGIWERFDPALFTIQKFRSDPEETWEQLAKAGEEIMGNEVEPNPAHNALAEMEKMGILKAVITQNIDGLHQRAGNSPENVIELHGNLKELECMSCKTRVPLSEGLQEFPPICKKCSSIMKPAAVFFGEQLPRGALLRAHSLAEKSDAFLVIGSSLLVHPAASLPPTAAKTGADLIIVNRDKTSMDSQADIVIHGKAGQILPKILDNVKEMLS